jgi:hypothetical protein
VFAAEQLPCCWPYACGLVLCLQGLQMLNAVGYGVPGSGLDLLLVYNPGGAFLAPAQQTLEGAYRQELGEVRGKEGGGGVRWGATTRRAGALGNERGLW